MKSQLLTGVIAGAVALATAAPAIAGPTVSVRIEGQSATLLPETTVTLPDVKAPGNPCSGPNAPRTVGAALEQATGGSWDRGGPQGNFVQEILGESHTFANNDYWAGWLNEKYGNGVCSDIDLLQSGDRVLYLVDISSPTYTPTVLPLTLGAPATAAPGSPFTVTATEYRSETGTPGEGTATPAAGATITGGAAPVTAGADGRAAVTLSARGPATLRASTASGSRSVPVTVCVTDGNDGFCGSGTPGAPTPPGPPPSVTAPDATAAFAKIGSVTEGRRYARGRGPRRLTGQVDPEAAGVKDVRVRLSRTNAKQCSRYDGARERLVPTRRCGIKNARTFSVGTNTTFDYLLPASLPTGRYVLDVIVLDRAGNQTTTYQRGRNRVVFFVG
jgi:hypothetical protein